MAAFFADRDAAEMFNANRSDDPHQAAGRFLDVLVADAMYMQSPFVKEVELLGLDWPFTLKENQPDLLREAERFTQESPAGVYTEPDRGTRYWHLPEVDWPVAGLADGPGL